MNTIAELNALQDEFNTDLDDLHERYAFNYALETLGLDPDTALEYAKTSVGTVIDTGDES